MRFGRPAKAVIRLEFLLGSMRLLIYGHGGTPIFIDQMASYSAQNFDGLTWGVVLPRWHHLALLEKNKNLENVYYLFGSGSKPKQDENPRYSSEIFLSGNGDTEKSILLKDKTKTGLLTPQQKLQRLNKYKLQYEEILKDFKPDYVIFPDIETVDGFLFHSICKSKRIQTLCVVNCRMLGGSYFSSDLEESLPKYFGGVTATDLAKAKSIFRNFKDGTLNSQIKNTIEGLPTSLGLTKPSVLTSIYKSLTTERKYFGEDMFLTRLKTRFIKIVEGYRETRFSFQKKYFLSEKSANDFILNQRFVLHALQYTPESSINGLAPYYVDQLRAIDHLLLGLPSGVSLAVKEHPLMGGLRPSSFYKDLLLRPNVMLFSKETPIRTMIKNSLFVSTITGTIAIEAFMFKKAVLQFGPSLFKHLTCLPAAPHELKDQIFQILNNPRSSSDNEIITELAKYKNISRDFMVHDATFYPEIVLNDNLHCFLEALLEHIEREKSTNP